MADDIIRAENSPGDMLEVTRMLQRRALARAGQKKPMTEAEKSGASVSTHSLSREDESLFPINIRSKSRRLGIGAKDVTSLDV